MAKIVLDDTVSGYNLQIINNNFDKIEDALQNQVLYRDNPTGEPNELETDIDANGQRIYNLPAPLSDGEPVRLQDLSELIEGRNIASLVSFTPYKTILGSNVQDAIEDVKDEVDVLDTAIQGVAVQTSNNTTAIGVNASNIADNTQDIIDLNNAIANLPMGDYVTVVDNVSALRVIDPADHEYVQTKGYHTPQDGGAGMYYYDAADTTTPEDGGLVIVGNTGARWKLIHNGEVYAEQFGARGDGVNDDRVQLQAAINSLSPLGIPLLLRKKYLIGATLFYTDRTCIKGVGGVINADTAMGLSNTDTTFEKQALICPVEGITALRNNTTNTLVGVHFESFGIVPIGRVNQDLPPYHYEASYSVNTIGIDLAYTTDAVVRRVMGKGLDSLIYTSVSARVCHRPVLDGLGGYSCNNFINFFSHTTEYCAADVLITDITMVRMMNNTLVMNYVDGATIADCKFFQASYNNVAISNSGFININGCTFFETKLDNVYIQDCLYVTIEGTIISRAGWYAYPLYTNRVCNLKLERCNNVKVDAQLERAAGYNYEVYSCGEIVLRLQNYYQWIGAGNNYDGVIQGSFGVDADIFSTRHTDDGSATGSVLLVNSQVGGRFPGNRPWALMNGDDLDMDTSNGIVLHHRLVEPENIAPAGSVELQTRYVTVRPGQSVRVRNISYDAGELVRIRVNSYFGPIETSADRQVPSTEGGSLIFTNSGLVPVRLPISMYIYNPQAGAITVGAGHPFSASVEVGA